MSNSYGEDQGTEAEYLDSQYDEEDYAMVNEEDDENEGGEFVRFPNRAREELQDLMFGKHQRNRHVGHISEAQREADRQQSFQEKRDLYTIAREAKVGTMIKCPNCKTLHKKTTYHKVFCSNQKTKPGRRSCKDRYWNTVDATRMERAITSVAMQGK